MQSIAKSEVAVTKTTDSGKIRLGGACRLPVKPPTLVRSALAAPAAWRFAAPELSP
jgi:hypothetical protein